MTSAHFCAAPPEGFGGWPGAGVASRPRERGVDRTNGSSRSDNASDGNSAPDAAHSSQAARGRVCLRRVSGSTTPHRDRCRVLSHASTVGWHLQVVRSRYQPERAQAPERPDPCLHHNAPARALVCTEGCCSAGSRPTGLVAQPTNSPERKLKSCQRDARCADGAALRARVAQTAASQTSPGLPLPCGSHPHPRSP